MIEKMKFLSITGPKADIDRVVNTYLSKYEIHLENALSELTAVESLSPFMKSIHIRKHSLLPTVSMMNWQIRRRFLPNPWILNRL